MYEYSNTSRTAISIRLGAQIYLFASTDKFCVPIKDQKWALLQDAGISVLDILASPQNAAAVIKKPNVCKPCK